MKVKKTARYLIYSSSLLLALVYGAVIGRFQLPPYLTVVAFFNQNFVEEQPQLPEPPTQIPREYTETPVEYTETDIDELFSIRTPDDIYGRRDKLIRFLWGKSELPLTLP